MDLNTLAVMMMGGKGTLAFRLIAGWTSGYGCTLLTSAVVQDSAKSNIVLTFVDTVTATTAATGHTYSVNGGAAETPTASILGSVLTLTMTSPIAYGDTVTWSYDDSGDMAIGGEQLEAVTNRSVINNVAVDSSTAIVSIHNPDYAGYSGVSVSSITPAIDMHDTTAAAPCLIQASAATSTAVGTTKTGLNVNPKIHIEWRWKIRDSNGDLVVNWVNNGLGTYNPVSGEYENDYKDQIGPIAHFPIYELTPDTYTIELTGRAPDGSGGYTVASTTTTFTTTASWVGYDHIWVDGLTGSDTNNGYDPFGSSYTGGTYDNSTGILTATGAFTTAFADQIKSTSTISPTHTNTFHYFNSDGVTRRGEYLDADRFQVVLEDRDAGIPTTGLTSNTVDGPVATYYKDQDGASAGPDRVFHVNGNAGASSYTQDNNRLGLAAGHLSVIGFNGDASDNYRVSVTQTTDISTNQMCYLNRDGKHYYISGMNYDCAYLAGAALGFNRTSSGDTVAMIQIADNVKIDRTTGTAGITFLDNSYTTRGASQCAIIGGDIVNKRHASAPDKALGVYSLHSKTSWFTVRGLDVITDADGSVFDHYIYTNGYIDRTMVTCVYAHGADPATKPSYFLNANCKGATTSDIADLVFSADNLANDCDYYSDASNSNSNKTEAWFGNQLHARSVCEADRDFTYYTACHSSAFLNNALIAERVNVPLSYRFYNDQDKGGAYTWEVFLEGNRTYNGKLNNIHGSNIGTSTFEFIDNDTQNIGTGYYTGDYDDVLFGTTHYLENNHYNGDLTNVVGTTNVDDASNPTVAVMNSELQTATGYTNTSTNTQPDWQDPTEYNFLPSGFESLSPTVNTHPVTTITKADGEFMVLSADFEQATSHQWQVDTGGGYADITDATSPVLTIEVATADSGNTYRCVGTNAAGSTNSNSCTLSTGSLELTLDGTSSWLSFANTTLSSSYTVSIDVSTTDTTFSLINGSSSRAVCTVASGIVTHNGSGLTIGGVAITTGSNVSAYLDGTSRTWVFTPGGNYQFNRIGVDHLGNNYLLGIVKNISINLAAGTTTWVIDSGNTTTETPTIDDNTIGNITFNNVVSGDWA